MALIIFCIDSNRDFHIQYTLIVQLCDAKNVDDEGNRKRFFLYTPNGAHCVDQGGNVNVGGLIQARLCNNMTFEIPTVKKKDLYSPPQPSPKPASTPFPEPASNLSASFATALSKDCSKPSPTRVLQILKEGNQRFYEGKSIHPHFSIERLKQAAKESQGDHSYATVIACSDSRVPVESIFDAGIMDIFVIRVVGNVCNVDECGSIEYGLAHVKTPVLVVLGHTQCGAVTTVSQALNGKCCHLERNIPSLLEKIKPPVKKAIEKYPDITGDDIIPYAIEENVYQSIYDLFMTSPATRNLVSNDKVIVVGAVYGVGTGKIKWLPLEKTGEILARVRKNPRRARKVRGQWSS